MGMSKNLDELYAVMRGVHRDPYSVLGMHKMGQGDDAYIVVRGFRPNALQMNLYDLAEDKVYPMDKIHEDGMFEILFPSRKDVFRYQLDICDSNGNWTRTFDSYAFLPVISEFDRHLFNEGKNYRAYDKMGSHRIVVDGVEGVYFAVWAPNGRRVSVVGDFNDWDGMVHQMRMLGSSGIWEIFIPGLQTGSIYKYEIKTQNNYLLHKADPYGTYMQLPPETASVVYEMDQYDWTDREWMEKKPEKDHWKNAMSIYEVHLGSWMKDSNGGFLNFRELAHRLVDYCVELGFTHLELLPIAEHPFFGSWGYQVVGYYAPTSRYGTPEDFMYFVDYCHQNGIGVILDWVPAHFPKDIHGLGWFDGTCLYEHADPRQGEHRDWGTYIYNYGRNEVRNFLISNLLYWCEKFHVDGFRIDAVASMLYLDYSRNDGEWIPNQYGGRENLEAIDFIRESNEVVHNYYPGTLMIAEESTAWPMVSKPTHIGGLGFDFKWNMGWMNDMLSFISKDPIYRQYDMNKLTFGLWYAYSENFVLVLSHDEVVHGKCSMFNKMPGDYWQKLANLRLFYAYWLAHPGKKLLFMGGEFGQLTEWNHDKGLEWDTLEAPEHRSLLRFFQDAMQLYRKNSSMFELDTEDAGFEWVDFSDTTNTVVSFMRKTNDPKDTLIFVFNFTPVPRDNYQVGLPYGGRYMEVLNSDSELYGGSNMGNGGQVMATSEWCQGQPYSTFMTLPPLGAIVLKPMDAPEKPKEERTASGERIFMMPPGVKAPVPPKLPEVEVVKAKPAATKEKKAVEKPKKAEPVKKEEKAVAPKASVPQNASAKKSRKKGKKKKG
jgi:1,4-alpha-glucan branching enzyme